MLTLALAMLLPMVQQTLPFKFTCASDVTRTPEGFRRCSSAAVVEYNDMRFESDWLEFDDKAMQVTAGDRVKFTQGTDVLNGGRVLIVRSGVLLSRKSLSLQRRTSPAAE
jgi:hypothetical protein